MIICTKTVTIAAITLLISLTITLKAQVAVNASGSAANTSAVLDVSSTNKGMLVPRMTTAQRTAISNPADALLVFDTTTDSFWYYNGTAAQWQKVGNSVAGANEINELSDAISDATSLFLGNNAGTNDSGTNSNVGIGLYALNQNTVGGLNSAVGYQCMYHNTSGDFNVALGMNALISNTTGSHNVSIGFAAADKNTTGYQNTVVGMYSNNYNQDGIRNTIIGYEAGKGTAIHNKSGNVFLGCQAGFNETGDNKLYIENSNSSTPLIGGDFANDSLFFNGVVRITGGNPALNKILTSDANGNATWEANGAATEINGLSDAIYDGSSLYLGVNAGDNDIGPSQNVGVGKYALQNNSSGFMNTSTGVYSLQTNTSGQNNVAFGNSALKSNSTGSFNTALGSTVLQNNTADNNTAIGYAAMITNTSGYKNVAVGVSALKQNVNGYYNVAVGFEALREVQSGKYNSAFGANSLLNTTGNRNTGNGYYSLSSNITGSYNTALGYRSGYNNVSGTYNTFIGYNARVDNTAAKTNSTAVGNDAIITASNQVRIGNASVTDIGGYADWTNVSDRRFKSNIKENVSGLDFIMKLRPVTYNLDVNKINEFLGINNSVGTSAKSQTIQTGFIAQEVETAAKELGYDFSGVAKPENDDDHYGLRYAQFVIPLVKAVQEQQQIIDKLQKENIELKKLRKEMDELKEILKNKK